jgi:hypothetical protein
MKSFYAILITIFATACGGNVTENYYNSDVNPADGSTEQTGGTSAQGGSGGAADAPVRGEPRSDSGGAAAATRAALDAAPVIIWEPIPEPLHAGVNTIVRITVSNASDVNPFALQQMLFSITSGSGAEYEVIPDPTIGINDLYNVNAFWLNGEVLTWSTLVPASQPSVGVFVFREGDHLVTGESPMRIEARVNVTNAPSGSWIKTELHNRCPLDEYDGYVYLVGLDSPGVWLSMKATDVQGAFASTLLWSDLSAGPGHNPYDYPYYSTSDYLTGYLVEGISGSSVIVAP